MSSSAARPVFEAFSLAVLHPDEVPGSLESLAVRGDQLVVGTSDGQLLLYEISPYSIEPPSCSLLARRGLGCAATICCLWP